MPAVTVEFNPNGLPYASTQSPTCTPSELPNFAHGKLVVRVNLDDREVRVLVGADHAGVVVGGIAVERDLNLGGIVDHVVVGENEVPLSTITPEPRLRSASGASFGESKKRSKKSPKGSCRGPPRGCALLPLIFR